VLEIRDLSVAYEGIPALRGATLEVRQGELVALVGPNGAGKSTLLKAVVGVVQASGGTVAFDGEPLLGEVPEKIVRRGIALVPENRRIFGTLSVAENLELGLTASTKEARGQSEDLEAALDRFPVLRSYYRSSASLLSGGEQQQLAIARALLSAPRLLLLDEPSLGLAPIIVEELFGTLLDLKAAGMTILLVEQKAARAVAMADRSYALRTGEIVLEGTPETFADSDELARAYLSG
jgi:branched-chain amino acid transport system ATP-binding protein